MGFIMHGHEILAAIISLAVDRGELTIMLCSDCGISASTNHRHKIASHSYVV